MFSPSAIAIVNNSNCPLLIRTIFDAINKEEAAKLIYLLHASLDIVEEKVAQPNSRDNFLGTLYQCETFKIYGHLTTTKIRILCLISQKLGIPRENDIRQLLKNIQKAYVQATAMNPFYKVNEPVKSKRLDYYLDTIFNSETTKTTATPPTTTTTTTATTNNQFQQYQQATSNITSITNSENTNSSATNLAQPITETYSISSTAALPSEIRSPASVVVVPTEETSNSPAPIEPHHIIDPNKTSIQQHQTTSLYPTTPQTPSIATTQTNQQQ